MKHLNKVALCVLALLLTVVLAVGLVACNKDKNNNDTNSFEPGDSIVDSKDVEVEKGPNGETQKWTEKDIQVKYLLENGSYLELSGKKADELNLSGSKGEIESISLKDIEDNVKVDGKAISVVGIAPGAFYGVDTLKTVDLTKSHTSLEFEIGESAFYGCSSLEEVTLPAELFAAENIIGESAFENCSSLTSITISEKFTVIRESAFAGCTSLSSVTLPDKMKTINASTFKNCTSLNSVEFPDNLRAIRNDAFKDSGLSNLNLTNCTDLHSIGPSAFANTQLSSVTIPNSVTTLGDQAFDGLRYLSSVTLPFLGNTIAQQQNANWNFNSIFGYNNTAEDNQNNFHRSISVTVTGTANIPTGAFKDSQDLTAITLNFAEPSRVPVYDFNGISYELEDLDYSANIPSRAFSHCSSLESFTLPNDTWSIDDYAFENCYKLKSFTLPASVRELGDGILKDCVNLNSITIEEYHVKDIHNSIGNGFVKLFDEYEPIAKKLFASITSTSDYTELHSGDLMYSCQPTNYSGTYYIPSSLTQLTLKTVYNIHDNFLRDLKSLTTLTIEYADYDDFFTDEYFEELREYFDEVIAPAQDDQLTWEEYKEAMLAELEDYTLGEYAFYGCENLASIALPTKYTSIGASAFYGCKSLETLSLSADLTAIGNHAFYDCYALTSITIPASVKSIGTPIFHDNIALQSLTIEDYDSIIERQDQYYDDNDAREPKIDTYSVYNHLYVKSLFSSNRSVDDDVYYEEYEQMQNCSGAYLPKSLRNITVKSATSLADSEFANFDLPGLTITVEFADDLFASNEETYEFHNHADVNVKTAIGDYAFQNVTGTIILNNLEKVKSIGEHAFDGANYSVDFSKLTKLETLGNRAFANNERLTRVTIPASVTKLGTEIFYNCPNITSLTIGNWGKSALYEEGSESTRVFGDSKNGYDDYYNLSVLFGANGAKFNPDPEALEEEDDFYYVYYNYNNYSTRHYYVPVKLTSITVNGVDQLGKAMFQGFSKLENLTINKSKEYKLVAIYNTFKDCESLTKLPEDVLIGTENKGILEGCTSLTELTLDLRDVKYAFGNLFTTYYSSAQYIPESLKTVRFDVDGFEYTEGEHTYSIPAQYFDQASNIMTITLHEKLTAIGRDAFQACGVLENEDLVQDNGYVITLQGWVIAKSAEYSGYDLVIPADTKGIADGILGDYYHNVNLYFMGTDYADFEKITLSENTELTYTNVYVYSKTAPADTEHTDFAGYWKWSEDVDSQPEQWPEE